VELKVGQKINETFNFPTQKSFGSIDAQEWAVVATVFVNWMKGDSNFETEN
jgi:hypothetical protein